MQVGRTVVSFTVRNTAVDKAGLGLSEEGTGIVGVANANINKAIKDNGFQ